MKNRLQFKHDYTLYASKEALVEMINAKIDPPIGEADEKFVPLFGEPVVFRYQDADDATKSHLALFIGKNGLDEASTTKYEYILIDIDGIENDIVGLNNAILAEAAIREANDTTLQDNINAEEAERKSKDNWLRKFAYEVLTFDDENNAIKIEDDTEKLHRTVTLKINEEEKVLSQNHHGLKTNIDVAYNSEEQRIYLKGKNGTIFGEGIDASIFIKDGFLESVKLIDTPEKQHEFDPEGEEAHTPIPYILLKWNTHSGIEDVTRIPLEDLIDVYSEGNGISIVSNPNGKGYIVSIKMDVDSEGFLTVSEDGLKLDGVQDAIDAAKKAATTKVEVDEHSSHLTISEREETDGSKTYTLDETNIASDNDLQEFKSTIRAEYQQGDDDLEADYTQKIATVNAKIGNGIEGENLTQSITKNKQKIEQVNDAVEDLQDTTERMAQKVELINTNVSANTQSITALENKVGAGLAGGTTLTAKVEELDATLEEAISDIDNLETDIQNKVDKVAGSSLMSEAEHTKLADVETGAQANAIETIKRNGVALEVNAEKAVNVEVPFESLDENEKQLVLSNGVLSSVFDVQFDSAANKIFFYGKNNTVIGELNASDFVVDGLIEDVRVEVRSGVNYLVFEFRKSDGTIQEIAIPLTDLVTEYEVADDSTNYLYINGFKIGVKVDGVDFSGLASAAALHNMDDKYEQVTEELDEKIGEGFVDESGQTISVTHKVVEIERELEKIIDKNEMAFNADFKVAGLLDNLGTGYYKNGDIIASGTTVLSVLKNILQKELFPTAILPTATLSLTNAGSFEVGTQVTPEFSTLYTNGKYSYADGTTKAGGASARNYLIFNHEEVTDKAETPVGTLAPFTVNDGTEYKLDGVIYYNAGLVPTTNLGHAYPDAQILDGNLTITGGTITGYRASFYGALDDAIAIPVVEEDWTDTAVTYLTKSAELPKFFSVGDDTEQVIIAIPANSPVDIVKIIDHQTGYDVTDAFNVVSNIIKIGGVNGYNPIFYKVYVSDPQTTINARTYHIIYR